MSAHSIYKPKITPEQRTIIIRALRAYLLGLVKDLDAKRPIGPELREEADRLEECFMLYKRFKTRRIGRHYPYWWQTTYSSRLTEIYYELREDARQEEQEKAVE